MRSNHVVIERTALFLFLIPTTNADLLDATPPYKEWTNGVKWRRKEDTKTRMDAEWIDCGAQTLSTPS